MPPGSSRRPSPATDSSVVVEGRACQRAAEVPAEDPLPLAEPVRRSRKEAQDTLLRRGPAYLLLRGLAPFRPDSTALAEMATMSPSLDSSEEAAAGHVPMAWRRRHVLCPARMQVLRGALLDLDSVPVREEIARRHPWFLEGHDEPYLDGYIIQGRNRDLTQALGRLLYREGAAGLLYRSKLKGICAALFERRARLVEAGRSQRLSEPIPEFRQACHHLRLTYDR